MSQEYIELNGSYAFDLQCVDKVLSALARPTTDEDWMKPSIRDGLLRQGICVGGHASRADLIALLWGRKRSLLRRISATGDWGPARPVA
ncbi:MAG: hypothetical protein M3082_22480 [Candidatus Dormibacteraeota bacterium]|nr:hypothetical protein [Candidatus Dormibacteraeota bacterium]